MTWMNDLLWQETVAHTIFIYSIIIILGVLLGKMKLYGVSLGITFVLFAGLAAGHFGFQVNHKVVDFIKDFGLILFVFSIGLQVGPGFFSSFRKGGLSLNILAATIVFTGALVTIVIHFTAGVEMPVMVGIMSGAVTNTPGLGAAQQTISQLTGSIVPETGLGYAVAYPFGVLGIILTMFLIRKLMSINIREELNLYDQNRFPKEDLPERVSICVKNPELFKKTIQEVTQIIPRNIVISRVLRNEELILASSGTVIDEGDMILVVTQKKYVDEILSLIGVRCDNALILQTGSLIARQLIVTSRKVAGKKLGALGLRTKYNVNITRIYRSGIEFVASPDIRLEMGDRILVVGDEYSMTEVTAELGNSTKRLYEPNIVPIFMGILLGVLLGSVPVHIPGIVKPVMLGLAGGPLIVAILLSRYGYKFSIISYVTPSANLMLRELGIVLFLASVGISAGEKFIPTLLSGEGFKWMGYGALITLIPLIAIGLFARKYLKKNYLEICGLLSGSMTDPPALAYANGIAESEAPAVAYASVYPLVMFLRIFLAQLLIILF